MKNLGYELSREERVAIHKQVEKGVLGQERIVPTSVAQAMEISNKFVIRKVLAVVKTFSDNLEYIPDLKSLVSFILDPKFGVLKLLQDDENTTSRASALRKHFREFSGQLENFSEYQFAQKVLTQTKQTRNHNWITEVETVALAYIFENNTLAKDFFHQYLDTCKNIDNLITRFVSDPRYNLLHPVIGDLKQVLKENSKIILEESNQSHYKFFTMLKSYSNPELENKYQKLESQICDDENYSDYKESTKFYSGNCILKYTLKVFRNYAQEVDSYYSVFEEEK